MDHGKILSLDTAEGLKKSLGADTIVTIKAHGDLEQLGALLQRDVEGVTRVRQTGTTLSSTLEAASVCWRGWSPLRRPAASRSSTCPSRSRAWKPCSSH